MATLGSSPSFNSWRFSDNGTSCAVAPDQAQTNSSYSMPSAGWVTGIVVYVAGDGVSTTIYGCVWNTSNVLIANSSGTGVGSGSRSTNGQAWHTLGVGFFLASGAAIKIGWQKPTGSTMVWSENGSSGGRWGYNGTVPGNYSDCGAVGAIGAYITYNPISNPSSTTTAATSVGSTTATLNGTVGDGGQNGSGDPNHSKYFFQYSQDPGLAGATNTSQVNFDGTGQAASQPISGLDPNKTYFFRVVTINDAGTTNGSILSFSTLGLPNAPTLNSPTDGTAVNAQTGSVTFAWTYNSGGGSGETNYALKLTTGGVDHWWNGTTLVTSETYVAEATTKTIAAGILAPGVTYLWTVSSQDNNGTGPYASPISLISEGPPNAPTLDLPTNGSYMDMAGATPTFSWAYNPGNAVGGQTNFAIRRKISGGGSYEYYNVGTSSWQSTNVWNSGSQQSFTFPAGKWTDGNTYNWSVATQDAGGQGPFASDFTVTAQAIPVVTALGPSGSIAASRPAVSWSVSFPSGASETAYQVRTFSAAQYGAGGFDPATSAATDDSGVVSNGTGVTSYQVQTSLPVGTSFRSYIQITETGAEVSGFLAFAAYTVTLDLPPTPTLSAVATTDPTTGCPMIQLTAQALLNILSAVDASFESGIGTYNGTNCALVQSSTQALDGTFSLRLTASSAANMYASSGFYAVLPSTQYSAGAYFRSAVTGRTVHLDIAWYDSTHTLISGAAGNNVTDTTSGWVQSTVTATSPSNAAYALVVPNVVSPANGEQHFVDEVGLFPGTSAVWSAGGFSATAGIVILRSDGVYVRLASPANPAPLSNTPVVDTAVVNDYEVTPLVAYTYQALLQATGSQGLVQSAYSASAGASVSTNKWWQLDPTNPASAVAAQLLQFNPSNTEQSTAHQVLGQQTMNIIASAMMKTDMTATVELFDAPTYAEFLALLTSQKTIFFSDPFGFSYYFRIAPGPGGMSSGMGNKAHDTQLLPSTAAGPHRTLAITGVAQPRPAV